MALLMYVQSQIQVPNIIGMTQANAEAAITNAGLTVGTVTNYQVDTVAIQDPVADTPVEEGAVVDFTLTAHSIPWTETFTGTNGDPPDPSTWDLYTPGTTTVTINNNKVRVVQPAGSVNATSFPYLNVKLSGDFSVQVDYQCVGPTLGGDGWGIFLGAYLVGGNWFRMKKNQYVNTNIIYEWGNPGYNVHITGGSALSGSFRLVRSGSGCIGYYNTGGGWVNANGTKTLGTGDATIRIAGAGWGAYPGGSGDFDNFIINSGTWV